MTIAPPCESSSSIMSSSPLDIFPFFTEGETTESESLRLRFKSCSWSSSESSGSCFRFVPVPLTRIDDPFVWTSLCGCVETMTLRGISSFCGRMTGLESEGRFLLAFISLSLMPTGSCDTLLRYRQGKVHTRVIVVIINNSQEVIAFDAKLCKCLREVII